jgi:hypothetical protein
VTDRNLLDFVIADPDEYPLCKEKRSHGHAKSLPARYRDSPNERAKLK